MVNDMLINEKPITQNLELYILNLKFYMVLSKP